MDHTAIIDRLGGIARVAVATGRHRSRIGRWRRQGIPPSAWADIVAMAKAARVRGITLGVLASGKPADLIPDLPRGRRSKSATAAQATA